MVERVKRDKLGEYLRTLRLRCNLTMRQTSEMAGVTQGYLSQIENGKHYPSANVLTKLAKTYGINALDLLHRAGLVSDEPMLAPAAGELSLASVDIPLSPTLDLLSEEIMVPLFDFAGRQLITVRGMPAGLRLPLYLCAYDRRAFVLEAGSDDLLPEVAKGDWVLVSPASETYPGCIAALYFGGELHLRRRSSARGVLGFAPSLPESQVDGPDLPPAVVGRVIRVINRELNPTMPPSSRQSST